jgi:hypothetical protein
MIVCRGNLMTPEERRARAEYVTRMAEQGIIAEPPDDRAEWERQFGDQSEEPRPSPDPRERVTGSTRSSA